MWFVALVFLGTGIVSILAYLDQIGDSANKHGTSPFIEANTDGDLHSATDDLPAGLSKHYYNRVATRAPSSKGHSKPSEETKSVEAKAPTEASYDVKDVGSQARAETTPPARSDDASLDERTPSSDIMNMESPTSLPAGLEAIARADVSTDIPADSQAPRQAQLPPATSKHASMAASDSPSKAATPSPPAVATAGKERHGIKSAKVPSKGRKKSSLKSNNHREKQSSPLQTSKMKQKHDAKGWLPLANSDTERSAVGALRDLKPKGAGWVEAVDLDVQRKTRFANVKRPERPGSGPVFAYGHHPGLHGVLDGHDEPIHAVRFAPSGTTLVSAAENGQIRHWDVTKGVITKSLSTSRALLLAADWSRDWQRLALLGCSSKECVLELRDMDSGGSLQEIGIERAHIGSVALSPDGRLAATATDGGRLNVVALGTAHKLSWRAHDEGIWTLAFDPFGRYLATGGMDHRVKIWEPRTGTLVQTLKAQDGAVHKIAFAPNGLYIATAGADSIVRIYRASTGKLVRSLTGHIGTVRSLAFDDTGRRIASAGDHSLRIWDLGTGQELKSIGWDYAITSLAFSPDGTKLLAGDVVGLLSLWDAQIGSDQPLERTAAR